MMMMMMMMIQSSKSTTDGSRPKVEFCGLRLSFMKFISKIEALYLMHITLNQTIMKY